MKDLSSPGEKSHTAQRLYGVGFLVVNYASVSEAKQRKSGAFASVAVAPLSVLLFVGLLSREFILYGVYFVLLHTTCGIPALLLHFVIDGVLYA